MHKGFTILRPDPSVTGLQVLVPHDNTRGKEGDKRAGTWVDVAPTPSPSFVVNCGDLMELWSGHRWLSAMHRVVSGTQADAVAEGGDAARLSLVFFTGPRDDTLVTPMVDTSLEGDARAAALAEAETKSILAGEYLMQKIGVTNVGGD